MYTASRMKIEFRKMQFKVSDMTCGHCAQTIEKAIAKVDSAAVVGVDLATKIVAVESNSAAPSIKAAIVSAGFDVAPL